MTLIQEIASFIKQSKVPFQDWTIVLPSERMKKYLQEALVEGNDQPIFSPDILTIDNWMKLCVPVRIADRTTLMLKLFEVHRNIENDPDRASFDAFLTWGETLLNDFNDIDRYLTDPKDIFKNLASIREIENWSFNTEELTESQKRFMEFWEKLPEYYDQFRSLLKKDQLAHPGLGFRTLAENGELCLRKGENERFVFAGFNALSNAEKVIVRKLQDAKKATVFIDADAYYLNKPHHEAGTFIRSYIQELDSHIEVRDNLGKKNLEIELIACAQHTGQVKVMADILEHMGPEERDRTLVLLADESLIPVAVKNLPKRIEQANISMGIPLRSTAIRTLVDIIFSIQHNVKRYKVDGYYHSDVLRLMKHPFVQEAMNSEERKAVFHLENLMNRGRGKYIFIEKSFSIGSSALLEADHLLLRLLKMGGEDWNFEWYKAVRLFRTIVSELYTRLGHDRIFERAAIETFHNTLVTFENNVSNKLPAMGLKSFRLLFDQHWSREAIAYHGNPTRGMQITGLLESRGLDFSRIICIGLNEGKLPPTNPIQTMIPIDLRRHHKLPIMRDKQGIFAHHLYRLLHHCDKFTATYSIAETPFGMYEPSRYILQWEKELARENKNVSLKKQIYVLQNTHVPHAQDVTKTPVLLDRLQNMLERSLTASKLKTYLTCPLDFYYKHVLEFGDKDSVEEEIEHATFGTLIHQTLEELYAGHAKYRGQDLILKGEHLPLRLEDIDQMRRNFKGILTQKFKDHFRRTENFMTGNNYLAFEMATELVERFLVNERQFLANCSEPVYIEALEFQMEVEHQFSVNGRTIPVKFKGNADRIDRVGNQLRIIDYKTGKVKTDQVTLIKYGEDLLGRSIRNRKHVLQLIQYTWMYYQLKGELAASGIFSFLDNDSIFHEMRSDNLSIQEIVENYPAEIEKILLEMFDDSVPFVHTEAQFSYCSYCE